VHEYVSTYVDRRKWVGALAVAAVAASFGIGALFHHFGLSIVVAPPTALTLFSAIFALFNHFLWRLAIRGHTLGRIPDLRGDWEGAINIRVGQKGKPSEQIPCMVKVKQTWSRISIEFSTTDTHSKSVMASLGPRGEGGLRYEYHVEPSNGAKSDGSPTANVKNHYGTAHLKPVDDAWKAMTGKFYNDEGFQRWGKYELTRPHT
jgi:hypothetical protein